MSLPQVTPLPTPPPSRSMPDADFVLAADALLGALPTFVLEFNALVEGVVVANSAANYNSTSTTSLAIGTGSKTFTVDTGKLYAVGQYVIAASASGPTNYMSGQVTAYDAVTGSLTVNVTVIGGSGTKTDWNVALSGPQGATGPSGGAGTFAELVGATMTGPFITVASGTGAAGFNLPPGAAPSSPANGDLWTTTAGLLVRINGVTQDVLFKSGGTMTGAVVLTTDSTVKDSGGTGHAIGFRGLPQNPQNGNYTLALTDDGGHVFSANTGAQSITIPTNSSVAFPIGAVIGIVNNGTTAISVLASGITLKRAGTTDTGTRTLAANGIATLLNVGTNTWFITGAGLT